jgi:RNA polymerase sigma-70 factor (ECF subfamily)
MASEKRRLVAQDPEAVPDLADFYAMFYPRLVAALCLAAPDRGEAEDAAQEAFARLLRPGRWGLLASPEAWLYTVGVNLLRRRWRRLSRARDRLPISAERGPSPDELEDAAQRLDLREAINTLPARYRDPLVMFHLLDLPVAQIAAHTGTSVGTVKSQLSRGRDLLAGRLAEVSPS